MDADDEIDADTYERVYQAVKDTLPDVAVFGGGAELRPRGRLKSTKRITPVRKVFSSRNQLREYVIELENPHYTGICGTSCMTPNI